MGGLKKILKIGSGMSTAKKVYKKSGAKNLAKRGAKKTRRYAGKVPGVKDAVGLGTKIGGTGVGVAGAAKPKTSLLGGV